MTSSLDANFTEYVKGNWIQNIKRCAANNEQESSKCYLGPKPNEKREEEATWPSKPLPFKYKMDSLEVSKKKAAEVAPHYFGDIVYKKVKRKNITGVVVDYNAETRLFKVKYDDHEEEMDEFELRRYLTSPEELEWRKEVRRKHLLTERANRTVFKRPGRIAMIIKQQPHAPVMVKSPTRRPGCTCEFKNDSQTKPKFGDA